MAEELREQIIKEGTDLENEGGLVQRVLSLSPWQRLTLAFLLLLDVALCGYVALVMVGRVPPPL